jgi:hypothetical protein
METEVASQKKNGETTAMNDIFKAFEPKVFFGLDSKQGLRIE